MKLLPPPLYFQPDYPTEQICEARAISPAEGGRELSPENFEVIAHWYCDPGLTNAQE